MMIEQIIIELSFVLVVGFLLSLFARFLNIPDILVLLIVGYILGNVHYKNVFPLTFTSDVVEFVALVSLLLIIFAGNIRTKFSVLDKYFLSVLKFIFVYMLFEIVFIAALFYFLVGLSFGLSLVVSTVITGASPLAGSLFKYVKSKAGLFLNVEAEIPSFDAIFALIFLDLIRFDKTLPFHILLFGNVEQIIVKLVVGLGVGVFVGLITYKAMQRQYDVMFTPLGLIVSLFFSYSLAKYFGGSGVLSLTAFSLILGNLNIKNIKQGIPFVNSFTEIFYIFLGIIIGTFIHIPYDVYFFITSFLVYFVFLLIRFFVAKFLLKHDLRTFKDKFIFSFGSTRGFSAIALALIILQTNIPYSALAFTYLISFLFYSIVLSSILALFMQLKN